MSHYGGARAGPAGGWLEGDQQRAWLAYIRVQLRLAYEMNRQLLADSGMSLPDYDVLTALSVADGDRMQITVLAAQIGWVPLQRFASDSPAPKSEPTTTQNGPAPTMPPSDSHVC